MNRKVFYSGKSGAAEEKKGDAAPADEVEMITKLLTNPETAGLLKALVKAMENDK